VGTSAAERQAITDLANNGDATIAAAKAAQAAADLEAAAHAVMEKTMAARAAAGDSSVSVTFSASALGVSHAALLAAAQAEKTTWEGLGYTVTLTDDGQDQITVDASWS